MELFFFSPESYDDDDDDEDDDEDEEDEDEPLLLFSSSSGGGPITNSIDLIFDHTISAISFIVAMPPLNVMGITTDSGLAPFSSSGDIGMKPNIFHARNVSPVTNVPDIGRPNALRCCHNIASCIVSVCLLSIDVVVVVGTFLFNAATAFLIISLFESMVN